MTKDVPRWRCVSYCLCPSSRNSGHFERADNGVWVKYEDIKHLLELAPGGSQTQPNTAAPESGTGAASQIEPKADVRCSCPCHLTGNLCEECCDGGSAVSRQAEPKADRSDTDDAERYRWMRQHFQYGGFEQHRLEWYLPRRYGTRTQPLAEQLDEAIDEQRNAQNREAPQ